MYGHEYSLSLRSLYSQKIFISINKQHHELVFLPKNKDNALYIKTCKSSWAAWRYVPCHRVVRLQFLIQMLFKYLNAEEVYLT